MKRKSIIKRIVVIGFWGMIVLIHLSILHSIVMNIVNSYKDLPFDPERIAKFTVYDVAPQRLNGKIWEYMEKVKPPGYYVEVEEAQDVFKKTEGVLFHDEWIPGWRFGVIEMEDGEQYYLELGMSYFEVLNCHYHRRCVGSSKEKYEQLRRKIHIFFRELDEKEEEEKFQTGEVEKISY